MDLLETKWTKTELKSQFPQSTTVGHIIRAIEIQFQRKGEVICSFSINNLNFTENDESKFAGVTIDEVESVSVKTSPILRLVVDASSSAADYAARLKDVSTKDADLFRTDDLAHAQRVFVSILDGANWFSEMLTGIRQVARKSGQTTIDERWIGVEGEFIKTVQAMNSAFIEKDYLLLADILEYEWTSVLDRWRDCLSTIDSAQDGTTQPVGRTGENPLD